MTGARPLSIAIAGTRGVPPRYGGFETFAAELGTRLVERGHRVTVYGRTHLYRGEPETWRGIECVNLPALRSKYLETVSHAFLSAVDAIARRSFDVVLLCNAANAFVLPLFRAARIPVAINVDGIERKRKKWNWTGKFVYLGGEAMSVAFSDAVVADAHVIADYYRRNFGCEATEIAYGAEFPDEADTDVLQRLGVAQRNYVLYVSRFEPENHPFEVAEAFLASRVDIPLVMVGDAPYSPELKSRVERLRSDRLIVPGAIFGADYRTLQRNAKLYVQATEVGGTHPALIEAMASGGAVVALDTPENREVGGDAVEYFSFGNRRDAQSASAPSPNGTDVRHPEQGSVEGRDVRHPEQGRACGRGEGSPALRTMSPSRPHKSRELETPDLRSVLEDLLSDGDHLAALRKRANARAGERYSWRAIADAYEFLLTALATGRSPM